MRSSLEIWDMATASARVVLQSDQVISAPNWSPVDDSLLVNADGRLFRVPLANPCLQRIDTGFADRCNNDHGYSPDGRRIVLSHHRDHGSEIFVIPAAGGVPRLVSPAAPSWWHGWSPDGRQLAYVAARGSRVIDVYTVDLSEDPEGGLVTGKERRLTPGIGQCDGPDYSADGRHIYYNCDRGGHAQIWVMGRDGADQRQVFADDHVNWFPHPSPDGRHVIYLAYPPGTTGHPADLPVSLWRMDPDGGHRRHLLSFTGGQGSINVPNWSPDSRAFAFVRYALP